MDSRKLPNAKAWNNEMWVGRMLSHLEAVGIPALRRFRLFTVGCCRRFWHQLKDDRSKRAVEVGEVAADVTVVEQALAKADRDAYIALEELCLRKKKSPTFLARPPHEFLSQYTASEPGVLRWASAALYCVRGESDIGAWAIARLSNTGEQQGNCDLLRCIFGNPFSPVHIDPSVRTPLVTSAAESIYQERRFEEMPILADILEDEGCTEQIVLDHCRQAEPHTRGCWVLDKILEKKP